MARTEVIGTVTIDAAHEITDRGFATASWFEVLDVTPGTYDIVASYRQNERTWEWMPEPTDYHITVSGTIVRDFFGSSFGGVGFGSYDGARNAGKATTYTHHLYGYQANRIADDTHGTVVWADGVSVVAKDVGTYGSEAYPSDRRMIFHHAVKAS